jgi:hypothetical protein
MKGVRAGARQLEPTSHPGEARLRQLARGGSPPRSRPGAPGALRGERRDRSRRKPRLRCRDPRPLAVRVPRLAESRSLPDLAGGRDHRGDGGRVVPPHQRRHARERPTLDVLRVPRRRRHRDGVEGVDRGLAVSLFHPADHPGHASLHDRVQPGLVENLHGGAARAPGARAGRARAARGSAGADQSALPVQQPELDRPADLE